MKQLIIILILSIGSISLKAQTNDTPYYTQPNLHKFEGEWVFDDGSTSFKIILKVQKTYVKGQKPFYIDNIVGYHIYTKSKSMLQSSIGKDKTISSGGFVDNNNIYKINFLFIDLQRTTGSIPPPLERGTLELLSDTTAKWSIRPGEGVILKGPDIKPSDYKVHVPTNLVLKKVK
jgi:hypothetical protein